jgi:hypothetical protein
MLELVSLTVHTRQEELTPLHVRELLIGLLPLQAPARIYTLGLESPLSCPFSRRLAKGRDPPFATIAIRMTIRPSTLC